MKKQAASSGNKTDVSSELAKIESLAGFLEKELCERAHRHGDGSEEGKELENLYWIASTIRETACKASGIFCPEKPLN